MNKLTTACVIVALCAGGVACGGGAKTPSCATPVATSDVSVVDYAFDPVCVGAEVGATLTVSNAGGAPHSFTVKGTSVDVQLDPGRSQSIDLAGIAAGTYVVICTYHPQMVGALKLG